MILHLDMDAFFASIEQRDNPELVGQPVIIGGQKRGVVATASYEARIFGIHSAMPMAEARKLCPHGIFISGRGRCYSEESARIMASLAEFSPIVQTASIDEAYLDITGLDAIFGSYDNVARSIKERIRQITNGLTCSIGIAPVKFLAKICSDINKPDGQFILMPDQVDSFLLTLPITRLPGVGKRMAKSLSEFGIATVRQLRDLSQDFLVGKYGKWGMALYQRARGIDERAVHVNAPAKSESAERTFDTDIFDRSCLEHAMLAHAERVGLRLRKSGLAGRTITLKIKFADFRQITRSRTLRAQTNQTDVIYETGLALLAQVELLKPVRLIGLGVSGFDFRSEQLPLPGMLAASDRQQSASRLDAVLDAITQRFGKGMIRRASAFDN